MTKKNETFTIGEPEIKRSFPREYEGRAILMGGKRVGYFRAVRDADGVSTGRVVPWIDRFIRASDGTETERTPEERRALRKAVWTSLESHAQPVNGDKA